MKKVIKRILIVIAILAGICVIAVGFFAIKGAIMWNNAKSSDPITQTVERLRAENGFVKYEDLPQFYIDAVVSVEDRKFFTHGGINPKSIARALLHDISTLSLEQGGSTITQQVAKNLWFTQEKRLERKFAEVFAAFDLEKELSKEEIFELYVNSIYFGCGYYGVSAAANGHFGKSVDALSDYECAMLAGLPNAPSVYIPNENPELARRRLELVLDSMLYNGAISQEKRDEVSRASN
ncbi:MAG: transglycosylase domain-containing protein [Oscillospiraceae bacterium]|nr:transglycosylase domain-containing protein [Oscillospiraceae bacterium]